jgi:hypothetical protein
MPSASPAPIARVPVAIRLGFIAQLGQNGRFGSETGAAW